MPTVAIDTAGPVVGVALLVGDDVIERTQRIVKGSDALLLPWVLELCAEAGLRVPELTGVGVAHGPGAFTGLRVGLATAVGLALSVGCPLWPGSSLTSRAARVGFDRPVLAMLDARKQRVYAQLHDIGGTVLGEPGDVTPASASAWPVGSFVATGEGALVYQELVEAAGGVIAPEADHPGVDALVRAAGSGIRRGEGQEASAVRPVYMRPPDAKPGKRGRIKRGA